MAKPGRPKGSKNRPKEAPANGAATSDGQPRPNGLTDDQREALFFQHLPIYEAKLAAKKTADANFKNACKAARSELGKHAIDEFKYAIRLRDNEDSDAEIQAEIDRMLRVARYMNAPLGSQLGLFDGEDRRPATERAYAAGKLARLQGEPRRSPHDPSLPQNDSWLTGYADGEKALIAAQKRDDELAFGETVPATADPVGDSEIGDEESTYADA